MFTKTEHLTEQHQTKGGQIGYVRVGGRKGEKGYVDCIGWGGEAIAYLMYLLQ